MMMMMNYRIRSINRCSNNRYGRLYLETNHRFDKSIHHHVLAPQRHRKRPLTILNSPLECYNHHEHSLVRNKYTSLSIIHPYNTNDYYYYNGGIINNNNNNNNNNPTAVPVSTATTTSNPPFANNTFSTNISIRFSNHDYENCYDRHHYQNKRFFSNNAAKTTKTTTTISTSNTYDIYKTNDNRRLMGEFDVRAISNAVNQTDFDSSSAKSPNEATHHTTSGFIQDSTTALLTTTANDNAPDDSVILPTTGSNITVQYKFLMETPIGSYTPEVWILAEDVIMQLLSQISPNNTTSSSSSSSDNRHSNSNNNNNMNMYDNIRNVQVAFDLFQRYLNEKREQQQQQQQQQLEGQDEDKIGPTSSTSDSDTYHSSVVSFLDQQLLNTLVMKWQHVNRTYIDSELYRVTRLRLKSKIVNDPTYDYYHSSFKFSNNNNNNNETQQQDQQHYYEQKHQPKQSSFTNKPKDVQLIPPDKLLELLDEYTKPDNNDSTNRATMTYKALCMILDTTVRWVKLEAVFSSATASSSMYNKVKHKKNQANNYNANKNVNRGRAVVLAELTESIFHRLVEETHLSTTANSYDATYYYQATTETLNSVLSAWSVAGLPNRAEQLLQQIVRIHHGKEALTTDNTDKRVGNYPYPNTRSYNTVLAGYSNLGDAVTAERILHDLLYNQQQKQHHHQQQQSLMLSSSPQGWRNNSNLVADIVPDVVSWNTVINAWAQYNGDVKLAASRAEQLLVSMIMLNATNTATGGASKSNVRDNTNTQQRRRRNHRNRSSNNYFDYDYDDDTGSDEDEWIENDDDYQAVRPDLTTYNTTLLALARAGEAEKCYNLLKEMSATSRQLEHHERMHRKHNNRPYDEDNYNNNNNNTRTSSSLTPDARSYSTVLDAFAKAGMPERAEQLLDDMHTAYMIHERSELKPSVWMFTSALEAFSRHFETLATKAGEKESHKKCVAKSGLPTSNGNGQTTDPDIYLNKARQLFAKMCELYNFGFLSTGPDTIAYNVMLTCLQKYCQLIWVQPSISASQKYEICRTRILEMEDMLQSMKNRTSASISRTFPTDDGEDKNSSYSKLNESSITDFRSYSVIIQTWLSLYHRVQLQQLRLRHAYRPGADQFCDLGNGEAIDHAEKLFMEVWGEYNKDRFQNVHLRPDPRSLHSIIVGFGYADRPEIAHRILTDVCDIALASSSSQGSSSQSSYVKPRPASFGSLVARWAQSKDPQATEYADTILQLLEKLHQLRILNDGPDMLMYRSVLQCWAMSHSADRKKNIYSANRAKEIFSAMRRLSTNSSRDGGGGRNDKAQTSGNNVIDAVSYNNLIRALARAGMPHEAEEILREMQNDYKNGNSTARPNSQTYNSILSAWVRHDEGLERINAILQEMKDMAISDKDSDVRCDSLSYNILLNCLAESNKPTATDDAENVLHYMQQEYDNGNQAMKPTSTSYGTLIKSWVRRNQPEKAEKFLSDMYDQYLATMDPDIKPGLRHFDAVYDCYRKLRKTYQSLGNGKHDTKICTDDAAYSKVLSPPEIDIKIETIQKMKKDIYPIQKSNSHRGKKNTKSKN